MAKSNELYEYNIVMFEKKRLNYVDYNACHALEFILCNVPP